MECGFFQLLRKHFSQSFKAADRRPGIASSLGQNRFLFLIGSCPQDVFSDVNSIERWLCKVNIALFDEFRKMAEKECQE